MKGLSPELIEALLKKETASSPGKSNAPQIGPLRYYDTSTHCASLRCGTATNYRVQGVPLCTIHALQKLNGMLISAGFKGIENPALTNPTPLPEGRIVGASAQAFLAMGWALGRFECIHSVSLEENCKFCVL